MSLGVPVGNTNRAHPPPHLQPFLLRFRGHQRQVAQPHWGLRPHLFSGELAHVLSRIQGQSRSSCWVTSLSFLSGVHTTTVCLWVPLAPEM